MPWTGPQFASRHNHSLHGEKAGHAARIASAVLRSGVPEGESIAIANKWAQRHADGGATKRSQASVHYGHGMPSSHCAICTHFEAPHGCALVAGQISPQGWCDLFTRKGKADGGGIAYRDDGGGIAPENPVGSPGGITPSAQNMNPLAQSMIQRYAALPPEKLAELGARLNGTPQGGLIQRLLMQKRMLPNAGQPQQPQQQTTPAPATYRRGGAMKRDMGGMMSMSEADPWWARREATESDSGFLHGTTGGRTDAVKTQAPGGSYVIPADVIAGLGEGNSLAGARVASAIFGTGPHGIPLPRFGGGKGPPRPPSLPRNEAELKTGGTVPLFKERARGGGDKVADGNTAVDLSHGEFVLGPEDIKRRFGVADPKHAYPILDKWVVAQRKKQVDKLKKLPGPVKP